MRQGYINLRGREAGVVNREVSCRAARWEAVQAASRRHPPN